MKKNIDKEPMLEETSEEILLEETSGTDAMLEETSDNEALLEEDSSESVLLEEDSEAMLEEVKNQADEKAAAEERYKAARERSKKEAEAERRRIEAERKAKEEAIRKAKEAEEAKRRAEEAKRRAEAEAKRRAEEEARKRAEEAKRRAEEEARRKAKEAEETKRKAEEERLRREREEAERKKNACWVIAALLSLLAGTLLAFGMKEENTSWGESLVLGYTSGLCINFAIIWGLFSVVGVDSEGKEYEKWRTLLCRCVFAISTIGLICYCIFKGTFNLTTTLISIYVGFFIASCANGLSHLFGRSK